MSFWTPDAKEDAFMASRKAEEKRQMRVNVYAEETTDRIEIISKTINGTTFTGLRFYLELPATVRGIQYQGPFMHGVDDDDSAAVTFWGKKDMRDAFRKALVLLDDHYDSKRTV